MYRSNLDFLHTIFKHFDLDEINVLIINQTTEDKILTSEKENIRVVNVFDKGLSKSRNLAIKNAVGEICFITDDDVEYLPKAIETAIKAYKEYPEASLISFQFLNQNGEQKTLYQKQSGVQNNLLHKQHLHSIEITLRPKVLLKHDIQFNTCFGIGALFHSGEEQVLRDDLVLADLQVVFYKKNIVKHNDEASVALESSKEFTRAITAVKYRLHKKLIYIWLIRYIWLLLKRRVINFSQTKQIWLYGVKAVSDYKRYCNK
jgi:glycosyltransferase involved in cell wall biosynthesis